MRIYATPEEVTTAFLAEACSDKIKENVRLTRLLDYYRGNQNILHRYYEDKTKPNNKIVVNYCKNIADFFTDYVVGKAVKYKNADKELLSILRMNNADSVTLETVLNMNIYGFACELLYTDEDGDARFKTIDSEECIVIFNSNLEEEIIGFVRLIFDEDDESYTVNFYTDSKVYSYRLDAGGGELVGVGDEQTHYYGIVPVAYYRNGKCGQGVFEQVMSMQDALNKIVSDNVNDFEQFVDSYLVIEGMQATTAADIADMKRNRVILTDGDSKVYWLTKNVDTSHIKTLQDDLERMLLDTCSMPNTNDLQSAQNVSGEAIKMRFKKTDIVADGQERTIKEGLQRRLWALSNLLNLSKPTENSTLEDVEIIFTRNVVLSQESRVLVMESLHSSGAVSTAELRQCIIDEPLDVAEEKVKNISDGMPKVGITVTDYGS